MTIEEKMDEIRGHLGAALSQSIDSDDQVIMQHVREAFVMAGGHLEWLSSQHRFVSGLCQPYGERCPVVAERDGEKVRCLRRVGHHDCHIAESACSSTTIRWWSLE